jgi:hypothetical protein
MKRMVRNSRVLLAYDMMAAILFLSSFESTSSDFWQLVATGAFAGGRSGYATVVGGTDSFTGATGKVRVITKPDNAAWLWDIYM